MKTENVNSSNIQALGYDEEKRQMQVDFHNKTSYVFEPVTLTAFTGLKEAESIGKHFNAHFRNNSLLTFKKL